MAANPFLQLAAPLAAEPWVERLRVRPVFQPIVDLAAGQPLGYEVLSRGTPPHADPEAMFLHARREGLLWELEQACRTAAIEHISGLPPQQRRARFFLNVSPRILTDPRLMVELTRNSLRERGLDPSRIVLEITERDSIQDYDRFESLVRHFAGQGFQIALDDFGAGHSSLVTLVRCVPHYLKLDREIVRDIDRTPYKQQLVKSLATFAAGVETKLIAEGVETWQELEMLTSLGVRYVQGYLLARPAQEPAGLDTGIRERLGASGREGLCRFPAPDTIQAIDEPAADDGRRNHAEVSEEDRPFQGDPQTVGQLSAHPAGRGSRRPRGHGRPEMRAQYRVVPCRLLT